MKQLSCLFFLLSIPFSACADSVFRFEDVTSQLEMLGKPYRTIYADGPAIYARNVWDLQAFSGMLFIGAGNSSNHGPSPNAGPVSLIRYDPLTGEFLAEAQVDDEQIDRFLIHDDVLYTPGHDSTGSWEWGNYYRRTPDGNWRKFRNIPGSLHANDLAWYKSLFFAAIDTKNGAAVAVSADRGNSWQIAPIGKHSRTYSFLHVGGRLFATKSFPSPIKSLRWSNAKRSEYTAVYELMPPNRFVPRADVALDDLFPRILIDPKREAKAIHSVAIDTGSAYIGAYNHNGIQSLPFGVFIASSLVKGGLLVERLNLPKNDIPWDLLTDEGQLYILTWNADQKKIRVLRSPVGNRTRISGVIEFSSPTFARSFAKIGSNFYFGLGTEINNPKNWKHEELSPETGQIIRASARMFVK